MTLTQVLLEEAEVTYAITERLLRRVVDEELSWRPATGKDWMTRAAPDALRQLRLR